MRGRSRPPHACFGTADPTRQHLALSEQADKLQDYFYPVILSCRFCGFFKDIPRFVGAWPFIETGPGGVGVIQPGATSQCNDVCMEVSCVPQFVESSNGEIYLDRRQAVRSSWSCQCVRWLAALCSSLQTPQLRSCEGFETDVQVFGMVSLCFCSVHAGKKRSKLAGLNPQHIYKCATIIANSRACTWPCCHS